MGAVVIELAEYVKAQRARDALIRQLGDWGWFLGSEVEVKPSGRVVILAVTTEACSSTVRRDIFVCIPSAVNGVPVETRPKNAAKGETFASGGERGPAAARDTDREAE